MAHATSFARKGNFIAACGTKMNEVALRANDVLRNDVLLRINEVALRANEMRPFARFSTLKFFEIL